MFRNRTNSQKPNDELYASFKASFPQLVTSTVSSSAHTQDLTTIAEAHNVAAHQRQFGDGEDFKDQDPTPRGTTEPWRFTPSLLDPNSFAFTSFANQPPGYYTPTPGGTNTIYHSQAGDLHTPGLGFGLNTPLSLPTSEAGLQIGQTSSSGIQGFIQQQQGIAPHLFQNSPAINLHAPSQRFLAQFQQRQIAPAQSEHASVQETTMQDVSPEIEMQNQHFGLNFPSKTHDTVPLRAPLHTAESAVPHFRFHVTLNAPTAMIRKSDEIPITYLNKGQGYTVVVVDTNPERSTSEPTKYRTYVRISFEDEQQRQRPGSCWQLWKEGRGSNEAHQRGGRLQAVEYVDQNQATSEPSIRSSVELESASFDGFSVTWSSIPGAAVECSFAVRFNFLSTDFSHSKGVKGIPVRFCAKTEQLSVPATASQSTSPEVCFCKVKLFRDHGAERKLSNDVAHVKKTMDKMKQQIEQGGSGLKDHGKRRRSGSFAKTGSSRPGKAPKHKRTWSISSTSSAGGRVPAEEDLQLKLVTLQDMFTSTRPVSVLYLKGEESDDPDLHPVQLSGDVHMQLKADGSDQAVWERHSGTNTGASSVVSPTPSTHSLQSGGRRSSAFQAAAPFNPPSRIPSNEFRGILPAGTGDMTGMTSHSSSSPPEGPVRVFRQQSSGDGIVSGWIEALGVDYSYQPPPERIIKPIACFYVQARVEGKTSTDNYYRAVYLMQRTLKDFVNGVALKCNVEPTQVVRTIHLNRAGLNILFDDESVRELPEGQDMRAEFHNLSPHPPLKREWDAGPTDIQVDGDLTTAEDVQLTGYELRLFF